MSTVTLEIPEEYALSFGNSEEEVRQNAKIQLAIEMYREGKWSTGKAAQFAGVYAGRFIELLRDRDIPLVYSDRMLDQDLTYAGGGL